MRGFFAIHQAQFFRLLENRVHVLILVFDSRDQLLELALLVNTFDGRLRDVIDQCWLVLLLDAFVGGWHLQDDARIDEVLDDPVLLTKHKCYQVILLEFELHTHLARVCYQFKRDRLASSAD